MDKAIFLGMNAQESAMHQLEILSNNLANVNTPGFRADYEVLKQNPVGHGTMGTRVYSSVGQTYTDFKQGPILRTGRELDVAISGEGFLTAQSLSGKEGYTRAGNLTLSREGFLTTQSGEMILGTNGVINIRPSEKIEIASDGTISARYVGADNMVPVARLKLVNPKLSDLHKGKDGLFYTNGDSNVVVSNTVKLTAGAIEESNVNPIDTLTKLIDVSRQYELHANFIKNLTEVADAANRLLG